eukprot:scaffold8196_cov69-Phaeocystis_antarctica.AAC.1
MLWHLVALGWLSASARICNLEDLCVRLVSLCSLMKALVRQVRVSVYGRSLCAQKPAFFSYGFIFRRAPQPARGASDDRFDSDTRQPTARCAAAVALRLCNRYWKNYLHILPCSITLVTLRCELIRRPRLALWPLGAP